MKFTDVWECADTGLVVLNAWIALVCVPSLPHLIYPVLNEVVGM